MVIAVLSKGLILKGVFDVWQQIVKGLIILGALALTVSSAAWCENLIHPGVTCFRSERFSMWPIP